MTETRTTQPNTTTADIRTSALAPRLGEDGDHIREYSPVAHDKPVTETPAKASDGKVFGTNVLPEAISVSAENARWYLAMLYGMDTADSMIGRATVGGVINGAVFKMQDSQAQTKGKLSITTDKSRDGMFVLVPHILRQTGARRK